MSTAELQTKTALAAYSALTSIVGTKIFADKAEQTITLPCVVFFRSGAEPLYTLWEYQGSQVSMTVLGITTTRLLATALSDAIRLAMAAYGIIMTSNTSEYAEETDDYICSLTFEIFEPA